MPVVHLCIDIDGILTVPCREKFTIPKSLQCGRQPSLPAGSNRKIASIIIEQLHQSHVFCLFCMLLLPFPKSLKAQIRRQILVPLCAFYFKHKTVI